MKKKEYNKSQDTVLQNKSKLVNGISYCKLMDQHFLQFYTKPSQQENYSAHTYVICEYNVHAKHL
jgi:hypothetical protein